MASVADAGAAPDAAAKPFARPTAQEKHLREIDASWRAYVEDMGGEEKVPAHARALHEGQRRAAQEAADIAAGRTPDRSVQVAEADIGGSRSDAPWVWEESDAGGAERKDDMVVVGERLQEQHDQQLRELRQRSFEDRFLEELRKDRTAYNALVDAEKTPLQEQLAEAKDYYDDFYGYDWRGLADMGKALEESQASKLRSGYWSPPDDFADWLAENGADYGLPEDPFTAFVRIAAGGDGHGAREDFAAYRAERKALDHALVKIGVDTGWERVKGVLVDIPLDTAEGLKTLADAALARPDPVELQGDGNDEARLAIFWSRMALADAAAAATTAFTEETPEQVLNRRAEVRDALVEGVAQAVDYLETVIEEGEVSAEARRLAEAFIAAREKRFEDWRRNDAALLDGEIGIEAYKKRERDFTRQTADDLLLALDVATGLGGAARRARVLVSTDASRRLAETLGRQADLLRWEDDLVPAGAPTLGDAVYRNPTDGSYVARPKELSLEDVGLPNLSDTKVKQILQAIGDIPPVRSKADLETFYDWIDGLTYDQALLIRIRADEAFRNKLDRRLRRASRIEAAADGVPLNEMPGRHEWYTIASLVSLRRMDIPTREMLGAEFTSPTSIEFLSPVTKRADETNWADQADDLGGEVRTRFQHDETFVPKEVRESLEDLDERDRLKNAARLSGQYHDELETVIFLASKMPDKAAQRKALALGMRAVAGRWLEDGVQGLPPGLQRLIGDAKLPVGEAYVLRGRRADQLLLDISKRAERLRQASVGWVARHTLVGKKSLDSC